MSDHERIERELHDAAGEIRVGTGISSNTRRRIRMQRIGTVATGLVVASALAFGATFAAGAFSTGGTRNGPADDSSSTGSSQTLYAIFDGDRIDLTFETEIDAICNFGRHIFADTTVEKAEIVEGQEARTSVLVFEPNPNDINMTIDVEDDGDEVGWCFEGLDRQAMDAVLESPERYFLVLAYRNGDEAVLTLRRFADNGDGNYATGPHITIAEGAFLGVDWEYYAYESNDGLCLELAIGNNSGGGCGFRLRKTSELNINGTSFGASPDGTGIAAVEGQVADAVDRLEIEIGDDPAESIDIVRPPEVLGFKDRVFVHLIDTNRLSGNPDVWLVAFGPDHKVLARERVTGLEDLAPQNPSEEGSSGDFAAIWPEDNYDDARNACARAANEGETGTVSIRQDAKSIALEFGALVLGWEEPGVTEVDDPSTYDHEWDGMVLELRRDPFDGDHGPRGPAVRVWTFEVQPDCWSIFTVQQMPDEQPKEDGSMTVRGRGVTAGFNMTGASSATFEVGYGGEVTRYEWKVGDEMPAAFRLDFEPEGTGHYLVLLRNADGEVFSAFGSPLPEGDFAAG